ncbi:hypothetical protein EDC04DRAFT_2656640 [Pisolithus marmoratus]|nr:hypothetical protein EDC04DRAFT_2656640 [Pisolithus marmoratus]
MIQFIAQLLLIPQGTLFGQMMFVTPLAVSWGYNLWLDTLMKNVLREPRLTKYVLGSRTSMVVFVLLILPPEEPDKIMNSLLPNDTRTWRKWKDAVIDRIQAAEGFDSEQADWDDDSFTEKDRRLLSTLFRDARDAYEGFTKYHEASDNKNL